MSDDNLNPYAPSQVPIDKAQALASVTPNDVTSLSVALWTITLCVIAGSLFGMVTVVFLAITASISAGAGVTEFSSLVLFSLYAFVAGALLALASSVPSVAITMTIIVVTKSHDFYWNRKRIQRFAMFCGAVSGFLPLAVTSMFAARMTLFSLVPAVFGAVAVRLMIIPLARRGESAEPLSSEPDGNYPVHQ